MRIKNCERNLECRYICKGQGSGGDKDVIQSRIAMVCFVARTGEKTDKWYSIL